MGHISFRRGQLLGCVSEIVGVKSGLLLSQSELVEHAPRHTELLNGDLDEGIRIHSLDYEEIVSELLHAVGYSATASTDNISIRMHAKYRKDPVLSNVHLQVLQMFVECTKDTMATQSRFDVASFMGVVDKQLGPIALPLALELIEGAIHDQNRSPWGRMRRTEWKDQLELERLFASEALDVTHGSYFDQRFIDYLQQNFDRIDRVHWRKFEALAAEYFERAGFAVELGKGRNDDGVDLRAWQPAAVGASPTILVQCKRTKGTVEKVVVKALWADVVDAGAKSGVIVTTSRLSPGAKKTCELRGYDVAAVDRVALRKWLCAARTPHSGVVMGE